MSSAIPLQPTLAEERIANEMLDLIPIANEKKKQNGEYQHNDIISCQDLLNHIRIS